MSLSLFICSAHASVSHCDLCSWYSHTYSLADTQNWSSKHLKRIIPLLGRLVRFRCAGISFNLIRHPDMTLSVSTYHSEKRGSSDYLWPSRARESLTVRSHRSRKRSRRAAGCEYPPGSSGRRRRCCPLIAAARMGLVEVVVQMISSHVFVNKSKICHM